VTPRFPLGPVLLLVALVCGIALGEAAGPGDARVALSAGVLGAVAALVIRRPRTRLVVGLLACALLGTALMQRALHGLVVSPLAAPIEARADVTASLTLLDDPDGSRFSATVLVRVDRFAVTGQRALVAGRRRVLVHASGEAGARLRLLSSGERATARGWLEPLTGFDSRWRWRHAVATLHATELLAVGGARAPLDRIANAGRDAVLRGSQHIEPTDRALLAGFLLGDTRGVPDDLTQQFRLAGLTHLTAVSGRNVVE
jgi:competence protein ComEC